MAMIVGDAKAIQAMDPAQLKEILLHPAAFDKDANADCSLQMKELSAQVFDENGQRILNVIAITTPDCKTPHHVDAVDASTDVDKEQPAQESATALDVAANRPNPRAAPFTPVKEQTQPTQGGIGTPQEFLLSYRQRFKARKYAVDIVAPHRRIAFKDLPEACTISDVLCLIHGGAVDRAWRVTDNEIIVQFCDDSACTDYYEVYSNGIRVDEHVIAIEKPLGTEPISMALRQKIEEGVTRVVHVSGVPKDKTFENLLDAAAKYDIDHIVWRGNGDEKTDAWFIFANMTHAWEFQDQLRVSPDWENTETEYLPDPCKEASAFHNDAPIETGRMSSAAANTANTDTASD